MAEKLINIWRVENAKGRGPYRREGLLHELADKGFNYYGDEKRPDPKTIPDIVEFAKKCDKPLRKRIIFGFRNLKQYRQWFNTKEVRDLMAERGYFLVRYRVPSGNVCHTPTQSVFLCNGGLVKAFRDCNGVKVAPDSLTSEMKQLVDNISLPCNLTP